MIAVVVATLFAASTAPAPASPCFPTAVDSTAARLNCMALYATPDLSDAHGEIALAPVASPFGVAVKSDGRPRYHLIANIVGLPEPRSLGNYDRYVAWGYTIALDSVVKLGRVTNGRVDLGEINHIQFRILITAENGAGGRDRAGRIVLRGTSPSARLLAHRDLVQPSAVGVLRDTGVVASMAAMPAMHNMAAMTANGGGAWQMPPMDARMAMMPGMGGLVPHVAPYLPSDRPAEKEGPSMIHARSGDTITLRAGVIHKRIRDRDVRVFGFNGRSPGPLIDVEQGATITVRVVNGIDAATAVHWHGVRLDNLFDGAAGITQPAIDTGGTFTYRVRFPDAGVFWYHPHVREDIQQSLGLFGNIVVRERNAPVSVARDVPLVLEDVLADERGIAPFGFEAPTHALMGRFGNVFLVNGEEHYRTTVNAGEIVRFLITNVSASRVYNLSIPGARLKAVGSDVGMFSREAWVESVVIAPAERYIVDAMFDHAGEFPLLNRVQALDHMVGSYSLETDTLATIVAQRSSSSNQSTGVESRDFGRLHQNARMTADIARVRAYFDRAVDKQLVLSLRTRDLPNSVSNMLQGINAAVEWNDGMPMMNWVTTGREVSWVLRDPTTNKEGMEIGWRFKRGEIVKLRVFNDPSTSHAMAHPIHIHGQRFLVLARDGVRSENLVWKDTALIPAGETVDLLVEMANPGQWMLHCHIAEHLSSGMMSAFTVQ